MICSVLPAPDECFSHITRLYVKKLKELKKQRRCRYLTLAGSRFFICAVQQVQGWETKPHVFASSAIVPAS